MLHPYGKNIQFSHLIKTEGRQREFNFRRGGSGTEEYYTIDVSDDRGNRIIFNMTRESGLWKIKQELQPLPAWILQVEDRFNELILENGVML